MLVSSQTVLQRADFGQTMCYICGPNESRHISRAAPSSATLVFKDVSFPKSNYKINCYSLWGINDFSLNLECNIYFSKWGSLNDIC